MKPHESTAVASAPVPAQQHRFRFRFRIVAVAALMALAVACWLVLATTGDPQPDSTTKAAMPALTVAMAPVARAQWHRTIDASGPIEPWQETLVGSQSAGLRLLAVHADVGDTVRRGQVLARFDDALLRTGLAELEAGLGQAEASARQAAANHQRWLSLRDKGGVSQQDLLQYATLAETTAAQVAVVRAQLASRRLLIAQAQVRAPDDGIVSARSATVGAVAESGQELFRVIRQGRLEWHGQLTASQLADTAPGQVIHLRLPDGSTATARIRRSAPRFDAQSRLATVYADIDPGSRARAGMYAAGSIALTERPVLVVPAASVVVRDGRSYVFRVRPGGDQPVVEALAVRAGQRTGGSVAVSGVAEGERVVVQGAGFLKDGDAVRILPAPTTALARKD